MMHCVIFGQFRAEGGELQRVLDEDDSIPEQYCRQILRQIIEGIQFLHRFNIAHLDIKVCVIFNPFHTFTTDLKNTLKNILS
jgi:serine/threonine protein kinase